MPRGKILEVIQALTLLQLAVSLAFPLQQFYFTGRQALANCANEGAVWQCEQGGTRLV